MSKKDNLLKAVFSKEATTGKAEKDEMVIYERNKITNAGFTILVGLLVILGIVVDLFEINGVSHCVFIVIGAVNYGMLLAYCKKGVVRHAGATSAFIWSVLTLPLSIVNLLLDKFVEGAPYIIAQPICILVIIAVLYVVSNAVYKKALKDENN